MRPLPGGPRSECVLCGKCLEVCPLYAATGREELSPKAKFFLAKTLAASPAHLSEKAAVELAAKCLACGKCEKACPFGLCAPELMADLRAAPPQHRIEALADLGGEGFGALAHAGHPVAARCRT